MNFSASSSKTLIRKTLRLPLRFIPSSTVVPILQGKLRGKKWVIGSSINACWLGTYEPTIQNLFAKNITSGSIVFDIGAHVGFYTLLASRLVEAGGKVVAFEPLPDNLTYLYRHLEINRVPNVEVIEAAVSDTSTILRFKQGSHSSMGAIAPGGELEVKAVSLDELLRDGKIAPPDFIKMDIEGAEYQALHGAKMLLSTYHPVIFLATHSPSLHRDCWEFLESLGYKLKAVTGPNLGETDEIYAFTE